MIKFTFKSDRGYFLLKKVRRIKKNGEMKIKNSLIKPIKKSIITWIVGEIVLLIVWCCDIKKILLYIPGIRNFVLNLNFITSIFTNYYTVIIGALFLVVILYLRKYADVKVPSISIAGIEFNLKNIDRIVKANLTNYFVTKRSLFKIDILKDNFDDVFESYHNTYEFIRLQMSYYENVAKTDNTIYKAMKCMIKDLNYFLTSNQTDYRRWYKFENEKEYKFIDELQKKYPKYNELIEAFGKINKKMSTHMQKLNITIEW